MRHDTPCFLSGNRLAVNVTDLKQLQNNPEQVLLVVLWARGVYLKELKNGI